jgi:hypothetical protein
MQPHPTPAVHPFSQFANGDERDDGCAKVAGKKVTASGTLDGRRRIHGSHQGADAAAAKL